MRRVSLVIQGTVEEYGPGGELVSRTAISQGPLEVVATAPEPITAALTALADQVAALFAAPREGQDGG